MLPIVQRAKPTTNMLLWFKSLKKKKKCLVNPHWVRHLSITFSNCW
jgi:hypothetical protein